MVLFLRRFSTLLLVPALAALLAVAAPASPASASTLRGVKLNASEAALLKYINAARAKAGLVQVKAAPGTTDVARRWARWQAGHRTMRHNPNFAPQIAAAGSPNWTKVSENVGYASACDARQLFDAYMNSPGHRANILDRKMRFVGLGSVDRQDRAWPCGILYNTMNFSDSYRTSYGSTRVSAWNLINY
jgi:uncharacterized protein YkwD